jgi:hypothetical protein
MGEFAIRAEGLGKCYRIRAEAGYDTLRDVLADSFWTPLGQFKSKIKSEFGRISQTASRNGCSVPLPNGDREKSTFGLLETFPSKSIGVRR